MNTALVYTGANVVGAVTFVSKDAGGNKTSSAATLVTTGTVFTAAISQQASAAAAGKVDIDCNGTLGSGTVAVKDNGFTSNAITIYCSDAPDSFTVAFGATVVAAGGSTTLTVKVLDENGKPARGCQRQRRRELGRDQRPAKDHRTTARRSSRTSPRSTSARPRPS